MRSTPANSALLLRCADAAGYGAVSFEPDDAPLLRRARGHRGLWRALLSFFLIVV